MSHSPASNDRLQSLDKATAALARLSARITAGSEDEVRAGLAECGSVAVPDRWVEELILQSYLFAGFPRALNAAREWRRGNGGAASRPGVPGEGAVLGDGAVRGAGTVRGEETGRGAAESYADVYDWRVRGEETCEIVYGPFYEKLRANIRGLHGALDEWMIVEGYGKVLSRDGLDLARRELCVVAACVAAGQDRQVHSHLHGARHAGAAPAAIGATLDALADVVDAGNLERARLLWKRVGV